MVCLFYTPTDKNILIKEVEKKHRILDFLFRSSKSFPELEINKTMYSYIAFIINHDLHIGQMITIYV